MNTNKNSECVLETDHKSNPDEDISEQEYYDSVTICGCPGCDTIVDLPNELAPLIHSLEKPCFVCGCTGCTDCPLCGVLVPFYGGEGTCACGLEIVQEDDEHNMVMCRRCGSMVRIQSPRVPCSRCGRDWGIEAEVT